MARKSSSTIRQNLKQTLTDRKFSRLNNYRDPKTWKALNKDERELLGTLFALHGEMLLNSGDNEALKDFDLAAKAAPKNPEIFYKKGLAYAMHHNDGRRLLAGCRAFEKAIGLEPDYFDAWYAWGRTLFLIGKRRNDITRFEQAVDKFGEAERCRTEKNKKELGKFYWQWGHCWRCVADSAGEASDFQQACDKFRLAAAEGFNEVYFWNDYGHVLSHLTALLSREEIFEEVVEVYRKAVAAGPDNFEGWFNLGCTWTCLYEMKGTDEAFRSACYAFEQAARCRPKDANTWFYWGQLLLTGGKLERDITRLQESIIKFARADELGQAMKPTLYCRWGEALMNCGSYMEDYQQLLSAKEKLEQSLSASPDNPEVWYFYGRCIAELGRYFSDSAYYYDAIAKYEAGQEIDNHFPLFYYGIALACYEIADLTFDLTMLSKALENFESLKEHCSMLPSQFWLDWACVLMKYTELSKEKSHLEAAIEYLEKAIVMENEVEESLEKNPLLLDILYYYGCALDAYGDFEDDPVYYEKAIKVLAKVLEVDPRHLNARYNLAISLTHLGEAVNDADCFETANEQFEIILQVDPEDEISWNDWGVALIHWALMIKDPINDEFTRSLLSHAEAKLSQAIAMGNTHSYYNMACYHSLAGNPAGAIHYLERADASYSLPPLEDMMQDDWLADMRDLPEFREFLSRHVTND